MTDFTPPKGTQYYEARRPVFPDGIIPEGTLPEWYEIFPAGIAELDDGIKVLIDEEAFQRASALMANRGVDLVNDYEHQTRAEPPIPAPASGWTTELKWDNGIWAKTQWTSKAEEHLRNKEYRHFSPGMYLQKQKGNAPRRLMGFDHIALTNVPRINHNKPLLGKQGEEETVALLEQLIAIDALGLTADATEDQALEVIKAKVSADPPEPEVKEVIPAKITQSLGLEDGSTADLVLAKVSALKANAGGSEANEWRLKELEDKIATQDAETLLAKNGAKLTPDMLKQTNDQGEPFWLELAKSDPKGFETVLASMPVQIPDKLPGKRKKVEVGEADLTSDQLLIAKAFGEDPKDFAKNIGEVVNG